MILRSRKHPPHRSSLERETVILLLTICTKNRKPILAWDEMHRLFCAARDVHDDFPVGRYVILPEHIPGRRVFPSVAANLYCRRRRAIELQRGRQRPSDYGRWIAFVFNYSRPFAVKSVPCFFAKSPTLDAVDRVPPDIQHPLELIEPGVLSPLPPNDAI
jgi:hypothetical protein